ncbi:DUF998 domain-containing protein [Shewanella sp. OPT22]|nr:DUF998 domain-containing protein [Shewanella sp. OPT22]
MNKSFWFVVLPTLSLIWLIVTVVIAGSLYPGYNHISQFISELAATGSPHGKYVNYLGFIPTELLMMAFILLSWRALPKTKLNIIGMLLLAVYAFCLGLAAFFTCDYECRPDNPTFSHTVHIALALPAYLSGIVAIVCISMGAGAWSQIKSVKHYGCLASSVALIAFVMLESKLEVVGLIQRILEFTMYSWFILFGYAISVRAR